MKNSRSNIIVKCNTKSSGHLSPTHKLLPKGGQDIELTHPLMMETEKKMWIR
jgi:hypothetical protein